MNTSLSILRLCLLVLILAPTHSRAASVIYSAYGDSLSGSLGGVAFSNAAYTIRLSAFTENIVDMQSAFGYPVPAFVNAGAAGAGSIEIAGAGTAVFNHILEIVSIDMRSFGGITQIALRLDQGDVGDFPIIAGSDFDAWNLLDPFSKTVQAQVVPSSNVMTSMGVLAITGVTGSVTYTTSIPEPSALSLLAVGLGGLAMMRRRRL